MRPSNNLKKETLSDTLKSSAGMYESPGSQFLKIPVEYNKEQTLLINQGLL